MPINGGVPALATTDVITGDAPIVAHGGTFYWADNNVGVFSQSALTTERAAPSGNLRITRVELHSQFKP